MQLSSEIDAAASKEIAQGLSDLRQRTRKLRSLTRNLERQLTGVTCNTLRLLLARQGDELHLAAVELTRTGRAVSGTYRASRVSHASAPAGAKRGTRAIDARVLELVDEHEVASTVARVTAQRACDAGDSRLSAALKRHSDAHNEAAWALAPLVLSSVVSCSLCAQGLTCPLSATADGDRMATTIGQKMDVLRDARVRPLG